MCFEEFRSLRRSVADVGQTTQAARGQRLVKLVFMIQCRRTYMLSGAL